MEKTIEGALTAKHEDDCEVSRPSAAKRKEWKSKEILSIASTVERRVILHLDVGEDLMLGVPSVTNLDMKK